MATYKEKVEYFPVLFKAEGNNQLMYGIARVGLTLFVGYGPVNQQKCDDLEFTSEEELHAYVDEQYKIKRGEGYCGNL